LTSECGRETLHCLSDDLKLADDRVLDHPLVMECRLINSVKVAFDSEDRIEDG
jgi:hypothetical protein